MVDDTRVLTAIQVESWIDHLATMDTASWLVLNCGVYLWAAPSMERLRASTGGPAVLWGHLQDRLADGYRVTNGHRVHR